MDTLEELSLWPVDLQSGDHIVLWPNSAPAWRRRRSKSTWKRLTGEVSYVESYDGAYVTVYFKNGGSDRVPISQYCVVRRSHRPGDVVTYQECTCDVRCAIHGDDRRAVTAPTAQNFLVVNQPGVTCNVHMSPLELR